MVNLDSYPYRSSSTFFDYEFESVGPNGIIKKIARFTYANADTFAFGFGDLNEETGEISDTIESNNGDRDKILATVASIINFFTLLYPRSWIFIQGSTPSRTRLYQANLNKHWSGLKDVFEIYGLRNGNWEPFRKKVNYEAFIGRRKASFVLEQFQRTFNPAVTGRFNG